MGLINGALQIGRSALTAYQSALQVVGNNIANVGTDGYSRQTAILTAIPGVNVPEGFQPGGGVALTSVRRNVDESLEDRYRIALGNESASIARQYGLNQIESSMNELSGTDLSTLLQNFFNSFSNLQNNPTDAGTRQMVLSAGNDLTQEIQRQNQQLQSIRTDLNNQIETSVTQANQLARTIADLNVRIAEAEGTNKAPASALRDQRDQALRQLGQLVQIQVREQPGGSVNVYVGNEPLVQRELCRGLTTSVDTSSGVARVEVRFADNNSLVDVRSGGIGGLINARDQDLVQQQANLDSLSQVLINEVNKVHSQGQGLEGFTDVTGTFAVTDVNAALNTAAAGLGLKPQNGSFQLTVTDKDGGLPQDIIIRVDLSGNGTDDSLASLVAQINGSGLQNAHAEITQDNRLRLVADSGYQITFSQDSSNILASLGVNSFFTGHNAQDISINSELTNNVNLLAAATSNQPGDGSNASKLSALGSESVKGLNNQSLTDFYNKIVADVTMRGSSAKAAVQANSAIRQALGDQRESLSGVNLDEETVALLKLERAFEGAARYTSTVNQLIDSLLAIVK